MQRRSPFSTYSLEGLLLKQKLQYFGHLMQTNSLEKTLMLGKTEGKRRGGGRGWDGYIASLAQWTWIWASSGKSRRTEEPVELPSIGSQRVGRFSDWATTTNSFSLAEMHLWCLEVHKLFGKCENQCFMQKWWQKPEPLVFYSCHTRLMQPKLTFPY